MVSANEIEETLRHKYKCLITIGNKSGTLYHVFIYIKTDMQEEFLFLYNEFSSYKENIQNLCEKIDSEIVSLFRKEV